MDAGITSRMMEAVADFWGVGMEEAVLIRKKNLPRFSTTLEWLRSEGLEDVEAYFKKVHPLLKRVFFNTHLLLIAAG